MTTIAKQILLNWLLACEEEVSIEELGKLIDARTDGKYILIEKEQTWHKE